MTKTTKNKKAKYRHNKKRNTAFLYEALILELTKAVVEKNKDLQKTVMGLIKESFSTDTQLNQELELYYSLCESEGMEKRDAERLVVEVQRQHNKKVEPKKLFKEQSDLIKKINKSLSAGLYSTFVPNYKDFATIAQLFSDKISAKERIMLEKKIAEQISSPVESKENMEPIDNLTYRTFVEKFNEQYDGVLHEEQKAVLLRHIFSFSDNGTSLKAFLNEEISRLRLVVGAALENLSEIKADPVMTENTRKVIGVLDGFKERQIDSEYLSEVLKIQQLAREVGE